MEHYKLFIQNSFKLINTALILLAFSQGFVATYKHISFRDLKKKSLQSSKYLKASFVFG